MAKILLVEDDNNLREIYEARLQAEGYTIVSAKDGEEALVLAKAEHPDLIISDVMMPRVSGFEMLDILRNTEGLKDTKIIMLTALGQAEDKTRADSLGADSYLVKSQVTLEDIVKTAQDLLVQSGAATAPAATPPATATVSPAEPTTQTTPVAVAPAPVTPTPEPKVPATAPVVASVPVATPPSNATPAAPAPTAPTPPPATPTPTAPPAPAPDTPQPTPVEPGLSQTTSSEEAAMQAQINNFINQPTQTPPDDAPEPTTPPVPPTPEVVAPTPPPAPEPPKPAPAPAATAENQANDQQLVADAVKNLSGTAPMPSLASQPTPTTPPVPPTPEVVAQPTPVPVTPPTPPTAEDRDDDAVTVAHKKIIKPIVDPTVPDKPDLNELLAREGIDDIDDLPHQPTAPSTPTPPTYTTPHPPGHVITPSGNGAGTGVDPNSIAL